MVNFLPPELRNKVMEKKPTTMAKSAKCPAETQRLLRDKNQHLGASSKPSVLAIQEDDDQLDDLVVNSLH